MNWTELGAMLFGYAIVGGVMLREKIRAQQQRDEQ